MSYEKQNFENGKVLDASQLNHIEDGIVELSNKCVSVESQTLTDEQKAQARANIGIVGSLQVELTSTGITDDETGLLVFGANKSISECIEAFENGVPVYGTLDPTGDAFGGVMVSCLDGLVVFEVANSLNVAKRYMLLGMNDGENDIWFGTYTDGATIADIPVPTIKATSEITPTEVFGLMLEGKDFAIIHTDATYGEMLFNSFVYSQALNGMVASIVFETAGVKFCAQLSGGLTPNTWAFSAFQLADAEDIPTSLPNPNALTINGTAYDGSAAVNMTDTINALIDAKLAEIPIASGVSF